MSALGIDTDRFVGVFDASFFPARPLPRRRRRRPDLVDPGLPVRAQRRADRGRRAGPHRRAVRPDRRGTGARRDARDRPRARSCRRARPAILPSATAGRRRSRTGARRCALRRGVRPIAEAEEYIAETEALIADLRAEHGDAHRRHDGDRDEEHPRRRTRSTPSAARTESGVLGTILLSELGFQAPPAAGRGDGRRVRLDRRCRPRTSTSSTATCCSSRSARARGRYEDEPAVGHTAGRAGRRRGRGRQPLGVRRRGRRPRRARRHRAPPLDDLAAAR